MRHISIRASIVTLLAGIAATALSACSSMPSPDTVVPEVSEFHAPLKSRVLREGEQITLIAFNAEGLSGSYVIRRDGTLDLGRHGRIAAAGLTAPQLEEALAAHLAGRGVNGVRISIMPENG